MRVHPALLVVALMPAFLLADEQQVAPVDPGLSIVEGIRMDRHPLAAKIDVFLKRQQAWSDFQPTGLERDDYLRVIAGQVKAMRGYQDGAGRIIDPVEKIEKYYATPCFAHSVAVLAASGEETDAGLLESGMKALDVALADMAAATPAGGHGDFYTWPVMLACELFDRVAPQERRAAWKERLASIRPEELYRARDASNNWNVVNLSGEYLRAAAGLTGMDYVETYLAKQLDHFTPLGMYGEHGYPLPYDLFPRHYLSGVLQRGYRGESCAAYRELLWRGAWTSLFMQSPSGELPTGYRSSHHLWNEAQEAVLFEIYAAASQQAGRPQEAAAFKRAARLALASILRWIRPDGSGYIVKNRYPIDARHGYESYSAHTCYNLLACSMLAQAWQYADRSIPERPAPADLGGYVLPILEPFHKIFASAGGTYVEYDTRGDHVYNPTGILRVHVKNGHPQLGPSDGCASKFSGPGVDLAVGPEWRDATGWHRLAALSPPECELEILQESPQRTQFRVIYEIDAGCALRETITVEPAGVTVEDELRGSGIDAMRVTYPMLVFDGLKSTNVAVQGNSIRLELDGLAAGCTILEPPRAVWVRSPERLGHRNGLIEPAVAEIQGLRTVYRIGPP